MRRSSKPPRYSRHSSGLARCTIDGRVLYLGKFGSDESHAEYARIFNESQKQQDAAPRAMTVRAVCVLFLRHAKVHYRKRGKQTSELTVFRTLLRRVVRVFGRLDAAEFSPLKLKRLRQSMIDDGWTRKSINKQVNRIRNSQNYAYRPS